MKILLDEMFPPTAANLLRDDRGHDAAHVNEVGLRGAPDSDVAQFARANGYAVVTENVADYVNERDIVLLFVLKRNLRPGGAQADDLATILASWADANPDPYLGPHWPH
ncbi:DUF5615 family PIN-like protein [Euzebya tangerina]|uniref:DUF5615 family PIN-like protein n=1 Tax=Euzebya tangerina TaxID=591198 RepID=UPI00196A472A|nr:DUF5615 family PIN-like protein [Euzebya tangerina]